jgi:hypothetical protein
MGYLETVNRSVLGHLAGFLGEVATHEQATSMSAENLGMAFALPILAVRPPVDPEKVGALPVKGAAFLQTLMKEKFLAEVYPMEIPGERH